MKLPVKYNELHYKERWPVREAYVKEQNGMCYYCHSSLTEEPPESIKKKKVTPLFTRMAFLSTLYIYIMIIILE